MKIVATAGHVDHGKSSLVRALTGTDPDRWDEEKRRGLTIDLGFAFTDVGDARVGFVDVPGHVRFLENMLAGVGSVPAAVLVVAAPEGWMPQTEEHLRILDFLGVSEGFVAVTMADLVDDDTLELATIEASDRVEGTFLEDGPVISCDSVSGRGIVDVRETLHALVGRIPGAPDRRRPRMWVDRSFAVKGAGTVVTGTLTGGRLATDDIVTVEPLGLEGRIRGIQSGHRDVEQAVPGARVALNLVGVDHGEVHRGDAVVFGGQWHLTATVDAEARLLDGGLPERRRHLKAHVGAGVVSARLRPLEDTFVRIHLDRPLPLAPGDRFVLRDPGPDVTLGGVLLADVDPPRRTRDAVALRDLDPVARAFARRPVLDRPVLGRLTDLGPGEIDEVVAARAGEGAVLEVGGKLVGAGEARRLEDVVVSMVEDHHRDHPLDPGLEAGVAARRLGVATTVLADLAASWHRVEAAGSHLRSPGRVPEVGDDPAVRRLVDALDATPFSPPSPEDLGIDRGIGRAAVKEGLAVDVQGVLMGTSAVAEATARIRDALLERGGLTVADVRDLLGTSRRYVIPLLNHLDREGVTKREGDVRVLGPRAEEITPGG